MEGTPEGQKLRWAITLKSDTQVIGLIVLKQLDDASQQWEVSFGIGRAFWRIERLPKRDRKINAAETGLVFPYKFG